MPSTILIHPAVWPHKHGPKIWVGAPPSFLGRGSGFPITQSRTGPRPTSILSGILIYIAIWPQRVWAENWGLCPFGEGRWVGRVDGSPSNTMWPGTRPTCMPSFILIRQTVWPQYTNVTDEQTGQTDNGPIA